MGQDWRDYTSERAKVPATSAFATQVYSWLAAGLGLTTLTTFFLAKSGLYLTLAPLWWLWTLGTMAIGFVISARIDRLAFTTVAALFLTYSLLEGLFFGTVLPLFAAAYGGGAIWLAFASACVVFALAVAYGTLTRADLTAIGQLLNIAVLGLFAVTFLYFILSFFFTLTWAQLLISYLGLAIFVGLTIADAQQIKLLSRQVVMGGEDSYKMSLMMALRMYINVVMVFWYLLQIFSSNSRDD
jgi:hypothetical protein